MSKTTGPEESKIIYPKQPPRRIRTLSNWMNQVLRLSWDIANKSNDGNSNDNGQTTTMTDDKTRLQALSLINDCYKYIMDLTTNGVVITDAIKFVQSNKEKLISKREDEEPDYNEDKDQLEEEQEEKTIAKGTTNQVF